LVSDEYEPRDSVNSLTAFALNSGVYLVPFAMVPSSPIELGEMRNKNQFISAGLRTSQGRVLQEAVLARLRLVQTESGWVRRPLEHEAKTGRFEWAGPGGVPESVSDGVISNLISPSFGVQFIQASCQPLP